MRTTRQLVEQSLVQVTDTVFVAKANGTMRQGATPRQAIESVLEDMGYQTDDERYWIDCLDLRQVYTDTWALARGLEPGLRERVPSLDVHYRNGNILGRAYYGRHRILLNRGARDWPRSYQRMVDTLIHEVAHFMSYQRGEPGHGDFFRAAEAELRADCNAAGITNTTGARSNAHHVVE